MGSIHVADVFEQSDQETECVYSLSKYRAAQDGSTSFEIPQLEADQNTTPTGMREEILHLAWLIVILRTQESGVSGISYEWSYSEPINGEIPTNVRSLSVDEVIAGKGIQSQLGRVAEAIASNLAKAAPQCRSGLTICESLFLSTSSLKQISGDASGHALVQLETRFEGSHLKIKPAWNNKNTPQFSITRHIETLVDNVRMCLSSPDASINELVRHTTRDLDDIWGWNHLLPPSHDFCMHDMIAKRAHISPEESAVSSWDGDLTYAQVDQYSTILARALKEIGVKLNDVLPLCFEKSRWTVVAVLATMKAGATFVLMDPTLPLPRLQNMGEQVGAQVIVSSRKQHDLSTTIIPHGKHVMLDEESISAFLTLEVSQELAVVPPETLMYLIFTSGSTGTPKGVKISHRTYTSSAIPRAKAVGYTETSRVLDFASYAFDVSIDSMLLTLGNGGCLCIPSDEDRMNDINEVMRRLQVTYAGLTPSLARILDSDVISSLNALGLGGEAVSARDANIWGRDTRIVIGYGPCECTIGCTINSNAATGRDYLSIGQGNGAAIWIVDPDDHDSLMPVGAVGELLVEGPIVGQGYLNDPEKTAAAFFEDPKWLVAGHEEYTGRPGLLYKTGDLGRYDPDGSGGIVFVGRKDTQVKLRGQRVELGEIESQLRERLPADVNVVAEVISPRSSGGQSTLVAFIAIQSTNRHENRDLELTVLSEEFKIVLKNADEALAKVLPQYMVPNAYIPVTHIPVLISSKIDRKRIKHFGTTIDLKEVAMAPAATSARELSDVEQRLQYAWSEVLKLEVDIIQPNDNFFALGGDSLSAMRLVSVCRLQGLELTVANTFGHPTLSTMAETVRISASQTRIGTRTFAMISRSVENARYEAAQACKADIAAIEDIYPCTPTQESLFTFSLKSDEIYIAQRVACIPSHIDLECWKRAWEEVTAANPILRSRLAQLQEPGLQQVVLTGSISWKHSTNLEGYLRDDKRERMELGQPLSRFAIVDEALDSKRYMVWTVHHVCYDGWSEPIILKQVHTALQGQTVGTGIQLRDFVEYVRGIDRSAMKNFWEHELKGAVGPQFPHLPYRDFVPIPDSMVEHRVLLKQSSGLAFTLATLIRGAWALVTSQYTGNDDVVFGETLTGRDIPLPEGENIVGPLIATVPVRIRIDRRVSVKEYLQMVQHAMLGRTPYQHMGMQNIRKVSADAQHACEAGTGLVIQPETEHVGSELGFEKGDAVREALHFNPYPLMLACGIRKGGFRVCASFDSNLIGAPQIHRMLLQLERTCMELMEGLSRKVGEISCLPESELDQLWQWNKTPPLSLDETLQRLRAGEGIEPGSRYPQAIVPWVVSAANSDLLSPIGCVGELWLEGSFLPGQVTENPAWLLAGSSTSCGREGKVTSTGDMVRLGEDQQISFVRRKDAFLPTQGHAVDLTEIEAHFKTYLPPTVRANAAMAQCSSSKNQQTLGQEIVIFVEQKLCTDELVELLSKPHTLECEVPDLGSFDIKISTRISIGLALALKKLDKFCQDSLPSYMVPSSYVVVERLLIPAKSTDRDVINTMASMIPQDILIQLRSGIQRAWEKCSAQATLTGAENILRSSWAEILGIPSEYIDVDDNFFRQGGDSVLAMKLVSNLRSQGHMLTVADVFRHMRLSDAAKVMKLNQVKSTPKVQSYRPFSLLLDSSAESISFETIRIKLGNPDCIIQDTYPVTDTQDFDIRATIERPRTSVQYTMLYMGKDIDRERLMRACDQLINTHDILRTVFFEHNSILYQAVLERSNMEFTMLHANTALEQYSTELCKSDIESDFELGSAFFKIFHIEDGSGHQCLVIRLSHAQYDGVSLPRLIADLDTLYAQGSIVDFRPFSHYIEQTRAQHIQASALTYWRKLLRGSDLAVLDDPASQPGDKSVFQVRCVDISQRPTEMTIANLLTASWALLLSRRLRKSDVTFGNITSGRNIDQADNVMGPCYQFTPVRVTFQPHWKPIDLLQFVQSQTAESGAYDILGFERIASQCTEWPRSNWFDSIVHHQDVIEVSDIISFGGSDCTIEVSNPHGDAARPLKAVSYIQGGQTHVGIVGSERDSGLVGELVGELVATVEELATCGEEHLLAGEVSDKVLNGEVEANIVV